MEKLINCSSFKFRTFFNENLHEEISSEEIPVRLSSHFSHALHTQNRCKKNDFPRMQLKSRLSELVEEIT